MQRLLLFVLTSLLLYKDLSGQCPDRPLLLKKIDSLKRAGAGADDQLKELLPYVHQLEACPRSADSTFVFLLQRLGLLYYLKQDFPRAVNYTRRAIRLLEEKCPPNPFFSTKCYFNLRIFYDSLHQKKDYLISLDSCISIAMRTGAVDSRTVMALWDKAGYYYSIGDYDRCYKSTLLGQTLTRQYFSGTDSLQFVHSFSTHAFNALLQLGKYDQLEILLKEKIQEFTGTTDTTALGIFMNQLASVYTRKHNYKGALDCLRKSYAYNESIHYKLGCSQALNNTGYFYLRTLHDYPKAMAWCRKALACLPARRDPDSFEALEALSDYDNIASAYAAKGDPDSALVYFQLAFDQLQPGMDETVLLQHSASQGYESKFNDYLPQVIIHKGDAFYSQYNSTHRRKSLDESIRVYKMADLFLERIKNKQSGLQSQLAFRKNARDLYEHAIRSAMAAGSPDEAFYFFERSRAILLDDQLQLQATLDDKAFAQRAAIRKKILRLEAEIHDISPDAGGYAKLQTDLFSANQELDRYDQAGRKPDTAGAALSFSVLPILRRRLEKNHQSFFELYAGDSAVYSLLITGKNVSFRVISKSSFDSLSRLYTIYVSDAERLNRDMPGFVRVANQLYQLLFPGHITPAGRVIISPDGNYFPFEALVINNSVRHPVYFLDDHPVCYTYSARYFLDTLVENSAGAGKEFMGMAPVQYAAYLHLPDLPGSNGSLDQIASWFSGPDKFMAKEASKASFLQNFSNYRLIQLYTHAVGNSPGREPLIYFADSALALSELIAEKKPLTRIIVLSACETANGEFYEGEGVFSFNREFAALGIPTAVVNLWSVDNKATYQLTELFFKHLSLGQPADIALQQAKKEFFRDASGEQRLPYYWAAPILTGQATLLPQRPFPNPWLYILVFPAALLVIGYCIFRFRFAIVFFCLIILLSCGNNNSKIPRDLTDRKWWKEAIVYQIYPRSFKDSDGDGIGDLKGIISSLNYIKSLGVDVIWLNPIYSSPNDDNGYDISDYRNIMKDFGTMADFDTLLREMHTLHLKLVMDLVVNHTSDEHPWFQQSRSSRDNPYRHYYHWWNAERGKPRPRWSFFDVNSDAWKYDSATNAYYLHYFSRKQPDLNWENPQVRKEVYQIMKFWLDKGIDGFRMDAFQFVSKDTTWPVFPPGYDQHIIRYYGMGPHLHDYLQEMNKEVISKYDIMTVAEGAGSTLDDAMSLVDPARHELNMAYHFEGMDVGNFDPNYSLSDFKKVYSKWDSAFAEKGWVSIFLGNHDQPRMLSHWGNDDPLYREVSAKMLTTFIMTMRGTPYCYYGDELGMSNIKFDKMSDYRDIATLNKYWQIKHNGGDTTAFITAQKRSSRDNGRTPFQWNNSPNAGFTTGTPWIKVNPDYTTVNAVAEQRDSGSILNYFKKAVQLRKSNLSLVYGKYTLLDKSNPSIYAYIREGDGKKFLILLNFKATSASVNTGIDLTHATPVLNNYPNPSRDGTLQPYEAVVYDITH